MKHLIDEISLWSLKKGDDFHPAIEVMNILTNLIGNHISNYIIKDKRHLAVKQLNEYLYKFFENFDKETEGKHED